MDNECPIPAKAYDKIFVINLDASTDRLNTFTQQFNAAGIEFERFSAINGYNIKIQDLTANNSFTGANLKHKTAAMQKNKIYKIICNPEEEKLVEFNYTRGKEGFSAGELGLWCSNIAIWKNAIAANLNRIIVFEDDISLKNAKIFKEQLNNFISHIPESFDIAYLDARQYKGTQKLLPNNPYVNIFSKGSGTWGTHAILYSKKGLEKILSKSCYHEAIDNFFWNKASNDQIVKSQCVTTPIDLETYVSSQDLLDYAEKGSIICEMGREFGYC